ncbi:MAG: branched-chain amino acid ABC transporter permease [Acidimicrobiia bacterium]
MSTLTVLNALSGVAILIVIVSGLFIILGLMDVINLMHPGLMAVGAYTALEVTRRGLSPWLAILVGALLAGILGLVIERLVVRHIYHRNLDTILATWGLALVTWQVLVLIFGRTAYPYRGPVQGIAEFGPIEYNSYRLLIIGIAVVLVVVLGLVSRFTTAGLVARAVMSNEDLARGMGLNTAAVRAVTFGLGSALAGMAGVLLAPLAPVQPFIGLSYLIPAFLAVLLAGKTVWGLVLGSAVLGVGQSIVSVVLSPILAAATLVILAVTILRFYPEGFDRLRRAG